MIHLYLSQWGKTLRLFAIPNQMNISTLLKRNVRTKIMTTWCDLGHHQHRTIRKSLGNTKALRTWLQLMMWKEQLVLIWAEICSSYFSEATLCIGIVNHSKSLKFSEYGRVLRVKQVCVILPMELFSQMSHNSVHSLLSGNEPPQRWFWARGGAVYDSHLSSIPTRASSTLACVRLSAHNGPWRMMLPEKTHLQNNLVKAPL